MENRTGTGHEAFSSQRQRSGNLLLVPITNDLCRETSKAIRYRQTLTGSFALLYRDRPFAVIFLPNPGTGRVFIKYLNSNSVQCSALKELRDTDEIAGFIRQRFP